MTKRTFVVVVTHFVHVELDESKFDRAFLAEFQESFLPFDSIEDHAEHIGQLCAREMLDDFTEGYGDIGAMGISAHVTTMNVEIES